MKRILIALLVAVPAVANADRIKVAVVPGLAVNLESAKVDALGQDLADALASELDIDAVGGLEVRRQLPADVPADCHAQPACVADIAKRTSATQLLFVAMVDSTGSGAVQVDSIWVDVASGKSAPRPGIDVPTVTDAKSRFSSAAKSLLPDAPVRAKPKPIGGSGNTVMSPEVPRHLTPVTYALAGVAAVGLGVGIGFGLQAKNQFNDCEAVACSQDAKDKIRTKTLIADTGFVVAVGGIVAASVLFATSGKESRLIVSPSPTGISLAAVGRF